MKQHAKWIATLTAVVGGLAAASSAQAQSVTGDANLDNIAPGAVTAYYAGWASVPPTVVTSGSSGLEIASSGYGSLYYQIPANQQQVVNPADNQVTLTFTLNSPAGSYYVGVPFILDDPSSSVTYGGYAMYGMGTWTETVPLNAQQITDISAGGDKITGMNLEFDPAGNVPGGAYDITFNSVVLSSSVPEPAVLQLAGLGVAGFLAFRRRMRN
jgi:hypothetical protein